ISYPAQRTASGEDQVAWRFNLRGSNTEPVIRLNVETKGDAELMRRKTELLLKMIRG
ncbi:hypothetical protein EON77_03980, partial [bacterium]